MATVAAYSGSYTGTLPTAAGMSDRMEIVYSAPQEPGVNPRRGLIDILCCYPVLESLATHIYHVDMLALSMTCKSIHQLLGHSTEKTFWKSLCNKNLKPKCDFIARRPCVGKSVRCIRCKKWVCAEGSGNAFLFEQASFRVRVSCQECVMTGYNPTLTNPKLFPDHTIRQLISGHHWPRRYQSDPGMWSRMQAQDPTFAPKKYDLFDVRDTNDIYYTTPGRQYMQTVSTRPFKPEQERLREFATSRCICAQVGPDLPICHECVMVGQYMRYNYDVFTQSDVGICECGTLLWDFKGEGGVVLPGSGWTPEFCSDHQSNGVEPMSIDGPQETSAEGGPAAAARGSNEEPQEHIVGLCSWCGFRVYQQNNPGKLPADVNEFNEYQKERRAALGLPEDYDDQPGQVGGGEEEQDSEEDEGEEDENDDDDDDGDSDSDSSDDDGGYWAQ